MNELIKQARELCEKATPGPWWWSLSNLKVVIWGGAKDGNAATGKQIVVDGDEDFDCFPENAEFIAASRTLVPQLCDALEAAEKELIDYCHTQKVADGKTAENARLRKINEQLTDRAEKAEAERDAANKCIYDTETYFDLGANKFACRTIKQYTHDAAAAPKGE